MRRALDGDGDRTVVERYDPLVGTLLDERFRIEFQLAAGGFGAIYRATDVLADAEVALKVLHPQLASDSAVVERFRREGKTLANLRDPHTITAYELGEAPDGTLYIVMELLHGASLYERFRAQGRLPWRRVLHIARGVCSSLAEAHAAGIVHRDLKPANIHLETRGNDPDFVKVLDFGIAKIVHGGGGAERGDLTQAGQMIGTIDYMSPEQMVGGEMTGSSDIYTLGVVIYEMISGRTPFADAQTATAILAAVLTQAPEPLSRHADIPPALDPIVARCLQREPPDRFADVGELAEALAAVAAGEHARPAQSSLRARPTPAPPTGFTPRPASFTPAPTDLTTAPLTALPPAPPTTVTPAPVSYAPPTGFDDAALTTEATRIDVRYTESSQPVLDARGPRGQREAVTPARPARARGSQNEIEARLARGPQPMLDGRGSQPMIDPAAWPGHARSGAPRPRDRRPVHSYELTAAARRDLLLRRAIWGVLLFVISTGVTLIATR